MAIQPCHTCSTPVESNEYFAHEVACSKEACQAVKREREERDGIRFEQLPNGCTRIHLL